MCTDIESGEHLLGKEMFISLTVIGISIVLFISHFGFEGRILVLVVTIPGICLPFFYLARTPFRYINIRLFVQLIHSRPVLTHHFLYVIQFEYLCLVAFKLRTRIINHMIYTWQKYTCISF